MIHSCFVVLCSVHSKAVSVLYQHRSFCWTSWSQLCSCENCCVSNDFIYVDVCRWEIASVHYVLTRFVKYMLRHDQTDIDCFVMFLYACHIEYRIKQQFKQDIWLKWYATQSAYLHSCAVPTSEYVGKFNDNWYVDVPLDLGNNNNK